MEELHLKFIYHKWLLILLYNKKVLIQMIMIVILIKTVVFKLLDIIGFGNAINLEQKSVKMIIKYNKKKQTLIYYFKKKQELNFH